jgi:CBS domain-containing protein
LPESRLHPDAGFHKPDTESATRVRADSAVIEVMNDIRRIAAATVDADTPIDRANQAMIGCGVRSMIVADDDRRVVGA